MKNLKMITNTTSFYLSSKLQHCLQTKFAGKSCLHTLPIVPVIKYPNAELQKKQILQDNKGKAGIYR